MSKHAQSVRRGGADSSWPIAAQDITGFDVTLEDGQVIGEQPDAMPGADQYMLRGRKNGLMPWNVIGPHPIDGGGEVVLSGLVAGDQYEVQAAMASDFYQVSDWSRASVGLYPP
ncbi:MAG TPA: hypothetical protein VJQ57_12695 [Acidimicrobiia bacterium]|nr:hypothetical protein [Acidimicrobiia bacterium]